MIQHSGQTPVGIPTVNFHLIRPCNMRCGYCFATFLDLPLGRSRYLSYARTSELVALIASHGFRKINFAGGEPTLYPKILELIRSAKADGLTTSIVTNGSRLDRDWLDDAEGSLDILTISIDSIDRETLLNIGRVANGGFPMSDDDYLSIGTEAKARAIRLKVNTVVNRHNVHEDLGGFMVAMNPERWKIFQALQVAGQNDEKFKDYSITQAEFDLFVDRHCHVGLHGITVVPENNKAMTGSYLMIDPLGRFFDNTKGKHSYSDPILDVGVEQALRQIQVYPERFVERGGLYD